MRIDGGCHCGALAYAAEIDPDKVGICHCTDCQTLSGTAFRTVVLVPAEHFRMLRGEPKLYVKTAESGAQRAQAFCPECGSQIYATSAGGAAPELYSLRVGTMRQRDQLVPMRQTWFRSAQPWLGQIAAIPTVETQ